MRPPDLEAQLRDALDEEQWSEVDRLGALLDAEDHANRQRRETVTLASAALWYAQQGLRVFPLRPGTKIPHQRSHGFEDGTTDPEQIRAWWETEPRSNIGLATGHLVDVIDVDGPHGNVSLARMESLPPCLGWSSTPRPGGRHLFVPANHDRGNRAGIFPGIDYRGAGGYVVVPPSVVTEGKHSGPYAWVRPLDLAGLAEGVE